MVWRSDAPQGLESAKVRLDLVQYMHGVVLDLGCGPQKVFHHVVGIDDDRDVKLFGIKANPDMQCDCTKLPFVDGYADTVFSSHLLEHVVDYKAVLAEWWRLVKPGGYLILYLPHADHYPNIGMPGGNPDHKHDFRNADITDAMVEVANRSFCGWEQVADEVRTQGEEYSFLQVYRKRARAVYCACSLYDPPAKPDKTLGLVRMGAHGDALWLSAVLLGLKAQGWHITLYTQAPGESSLRHDPNIDRMIVQPKGLFGGEREDVVWQAAYWLHEEKKYDKFINLTGCVERDLLVHTSEFRFYFAKDQRHRLMNHNYLERIFEWCEVPFDRNAVRVKFYPSTDEMAWAMAERAKYGPLVLINPTGSSLPKFWPHAQKLMELLDAQGVHSIVVGDPRGMEYQAPARGKVVGLDWDIRRVYTLAQLADVVVGVESAIVNSVAHEDCAKVVLLSHSSAENLTRDWQNTVAFEPQDLPCYPCHRIHVDASNCTMPRGFAACQDGVSAEAVAEVCMEWIRKQRKEAA